MSLTNYTDISDSVVEWLNRSGHSAVTDNVEDFLLLAHNQLSRRLKINGTEQVTTLSVDAGSETVPSGLIEVLSISLDGAPLAAGSFDSVKKYTSAGDPCEYVHIGDSLYFGPVPSSAVTLDLHYYAEETPASTTTPTNWFTDNAPELLLYGGLVEAYLFLKDDNRASLWQTKLDNTIAITENESWRQDARNRRVRDESIEQSGGPLV